MGKVKDEVPATKSAKAASKSGSSRLMPAWLASFVGNLLRADTYKPMQGWNARLWTALALGALVLAGVYSLYVTQLADMDNPAMRFGIPAGLGVGLGWLVYRMVQYPPFADFLIATESEMNKVSWTSWAELKRATVVVITTVLILSLYLFGVDLVWQALLKLLGVLRIDPSDLGSQAG